jgi:hypothetical protein
LPQQQQQLGQHVGGGGGTLGRNAGRGGARSVAGTSGSATLARPPRPQPIAGTPPPDGGQAGAGTAGSVVGMQDKCDQHKAAQQSCNIFGLDLVRLEMNSTHVYIAWVFFLCRSF